MLSPKCSPSSPSSHHAPYSPLRQGGRLSRLSGAGARGKRRRRPGSCSDRQTPRYVTGFLGCATQLWGSVPLSRSWRPGGPGGGGYRHRSVSAIGTSVTRCQYRAPCRFVLRKCYVNSDTYIVLPFCQMSICRVIKRQKNYGDGVICCHILRLRYRSIDC